MSAVRSRPRAPLKNRYQSGFFCARFQSSFVKKLALLGTGPALASNFRCVRIRFLAQEDDKDVAEKNNRYFGCFSLAIPTRTISKVLNFKVFFVLGSNRASLKNSLSWGRAPLWHLTFAAYAFAFSLKKMTKMLQFYFGFSNLYKF